MAAFVNTSAASTTDTVQEISDVPFTPKALLFFMTNQTSTGAKDNVAAALSMGMSDGTTDHCSSYAGQATGEYTFEQKAVLVNLHDKDGTTIAEAVIHSFTSTGFKITWNTNPDKRYLIHYVCIGGDAVTNVKVDRANAAATTFSLTGTSFTPDFAIGMHGHSNTYPTSISDTTTASFGLWMDAGASNKRNGGGTDRINDAGSMSSMAVRGGNPITRWRDDTRARVSGFTATGADFASSLTGAMDVQAMFIKSDGVNFQVEGQTAAVNVATTVSVTNPTFEPELVWILNSGQNTGDDFDQGYGGWCIGFADHYRQFSIFIGQDDDTPHQTGIKVTTNRIATDPGGDFNNPANEDVNVTFTQMAASGFDLLVNNAGASRVVHYMAMTWGDGAFDTASGIIFADGLIF
jgi:hypothetical protein